MVQSKYMKLAYFVLTTTCLSGTGIVGLGCWLGYTLDKENKNVFYLKNK